MARWILLVMGGALIAGAASAEFTLSDDGKALTVLDAGKPVLTYRYTRVEPPEGVPAHYGRMDYIHPLYGLDGDVLTQDFPLDHRHHRGVFWAWPMCKAGARNMDIWLMNDVHPVFDSWIAKEAGATGARLGAVSLWKFDDDPKAKVREEAMFTVLPADDMGRAIDFELTFKNVCDELVSISGQAEAGKGYGGFCVRPDAKRPDLHFTTIQGAVKRGEDVLSQETPWADATSKVKEDGGYSGVAVFQNPANPDYPYPGWILRHYGFLGASWPHLKAHELKPGESVVLKYRLYIHRGTAEEAKVGEKFEAYRSECQSTKPAPAK